MTEQTQTQSVGLNLEQIIEDIKLIAKDLKDPISKFKDLNNFWSYLETVTAEQVEKDRSSGILIFVIKAHQEMAQTWEELTEEQTDVKNFTMSVFISRMRVASVVSLKTGVTLKEKDKVTNAFLEIAASYFTHYFLVSGTVTSETDMTASISANMLSAFVNLWDHLFPEFAISAIIYKDLQKTDNN